MWLLQLSISQCLIWIYVSGQKPLYPFSCVTGHKLGVTRGQMNTEVIWKHIPSTHCICCYLEVPTVFVSTARTTLLYTLYHISITIISQSMYTF